MSRVKESLTRTVEVSVWVIWALLALLVIDMIDDENWIGLAVAGAWLVLRAALSFWGVRRAER